MSSTQTPRALAKGQRVGKGFRVAQTPRALAKGQRVGKGFRVVECRGVRALPKGVERQRSKFHDEWQRDGVA